LRKVTPARQRRDAVRRDVMCGAGAASSLAEIAEAAPDISRT
jgi:hypothetical protein